MTGTVGVDTLKRQLWNAILCVLMVGVPSVGSAESEAEQASELLGLALSCPGAASVSGRSKIQIANKSLGDADVFRVERLRVMVFNVPSGLENVTDEREDVVAISANYSDLRFNVVKQKGEWYIEVECKSKRRCISSHIKSQITCEVKRTGEKVCQDGLLASPISSPFETVSGLCPAQLDNIRVALGILAPKGDRPDRTNYRVVKVKPYEGVAVRERKSTEGAIVGVLPSEGSGVHVSACEAGEKGKRRWCRIDWGNMSGWAAESNLAAKGVPPNTR